MTKTKPGVRVVLQLDPRIALEAIILNRLERIPTTRRREWLRGLLLQGFRSECQVVRGAQEKPQRCPATAFTNWKTDDPQHAVGFADPERVVAKGKPSQVRSDSKPFAALRKVIG